jgi:hypothetical protein
MSLSVRRHIHTPYKSNLFQWYGDFEAITVENINVIFLRNMRPYILLGRYRRFKTTYLFIIRST